jgi:hypothetical protein|tara:strand:+ start:43 stop:234 length:192 start_codon:yes stop_codon:yes gene_type:complete
MDKNISPDKTIKNTLEAIKRGEAVSLDPYIDHPHLIRQICALIKKLKQEEYEAELEGGLGEIV